MHGGEIPSVTPSFPTRLRKLSQTHPLAKKKKKKKHPHKHTPCIVFSYAQLLMNKQRAVNCDGLSADIFPPHISEAREKRTQELAL